MGCGHACMHSMHARTPLSPSPSSPHHIHTHMYTHKPVFRQVDPDFTSAVVEQELFHDWCTSTYTHHVGTINFLADGSMVYGAGDGSHFQGLGAYVLA